MKPCSQQPHHSNNLLQEIGFGLNNTIAKIEGSVKKLSINYKTATVVLYNKANLQPIAVRKPNENGEFQILGLNNSQSCFIIAFDNKQHYNAVIQDSVVPK
ncbi:hypothetical protein [Acinetobacter sp.]|uniref:hypothetical protein n=1 Tax=Acinetobacter sp. TaxID=472 RepID=UPI0039827510